MINIIIRGVIKFVPQKFNFLKTLFLILCATSSVFFVIKSKDLKDFSYGLNINVNRSSNLEMFRMSKFDIAIQTVLKHEGGLADVPSDTGGITNYGVSLRWLKSLGDLNHDGLLDGDIDHNGIVDEQDIKAMSKEKAIDYYRCYWWQKYGYDRICDQSIATKVFDLAINMGAKAAHVCLQRALKSACGSHIEEDGILGPKTIEKINSTPATLLLAAYKSEAAGFYRSLKKQEFEKGWLRRAYA